MYRCVIVNGCCGKFELSTNGMLRPSLFLQNPLRTWWGPFNIYIYHAVWCICASDHLILCVSCLLYDFKLARRGPTNRITNAYRQYVHALSTSAASFLKSPNVLRSNMRAASYWSDSLLKKLLETPMFITCFNSNASGIRP